MRQTSKVDYHDLIVFTVLQRIQYIQIQLGVVWVPYELTLECGRLLHVRLVTGIKVWWIVKHQHLF